MEEQNAQANTTGAESTGQQGAPASAPAGEKKEHNTAMAVIAYFIFFVPLLTDAKNDPFVKYHVKQGLVLLIAYVIVNALGMGFYFLWSILWIFQLGLLALLVMGILNAVNGVQKPLPLIGQFAEKFNF